jgi:SAM-dependent methyltransferase
MTVDPETIATYNAKAQDYVDLITTAQPTRHLQAFMDALPKGGRALDLGCGPGNSAAMMRDHGFQVTAIDASPKMAELGAAKYNLDIKIGTFDDVTETAVYDGVWASFSLLHAARADIPRHLRAIHRSLKPGGTFVIGVKTGTGTARDKIGRQYTYFEPKELDTLLCAAGFSPQSSATGADKGLAGDIEPWIIITAHA